MAKKQRTVVFAATGRSLGPPPAEPVTQGEGASPSAAQDPTPSSSGLFPRSFKDLLTRWFAIDLRALAAFRIALALLVMGDMWVRIPDIAAQYTETGVFPLEAARVHNNTDWTMFSPYMWAETSTQVGWLFGLTFAGCFALLVGWRTRLATFLVWALLCSLHTRMPANLHSGDVLERMLLFWGMFLPLGARWSIDGGVAGWKARGLIVPKRHLSWGSAGLLLQVTLLYLFTGLLKSGPQWHSEANAVYYALAIDAYRTWFGGLLLSQRWLHAPLTHFTIVLELAAMPLAFSPIATGKVRSLLVAALYGFHLIALNLAFDLGSFPYVCGVAWIAFLPSGWWDAAERLWQRIPAVGAKTALIRAATAIVTWRNRRIARSVESQARPLRLHATRTGQVVAAFALLYVIWFNVRGMDTPLMQKQRWITVRDSHLLSAVMWLGRLDQDWRMFAPRPSTEDGWYVIAAETWRGSKYNLVRGVRPLRPYEEKPDVPRDYPSERWRKYMMNLWGQQYSLYRQYYLYWIEREWNKTHLGADSIRNLQMVYVLEETLPGYKDAPLKPVVIYGLPPNRVRSQMPEKGFRAEDRVKPN